MSTFGIEYEVPGLPYGAAIERYNEHSLLKGWSIGSDGYAEFRSHPIIKSYRSAIKLASNMTQLAKQEGWQHGTIYGIHVHVGLQDFRDLMRTARLMKFLNKEDNPVNNTIFKLSGRAAGEGYAANARRNFDHRFVAHRYMEERDLTADDRYARPLNILCDRLMGYKSVVYAGFRCERQGIFCINGLGTYELRMFASHPDHLIPAVQVAESFREFSHRLNKTDEEQHTIQAWFNLLNDKPKKYKELIQLCKDKNLMSRRGKAKES